jgi:hypothetical protein
MVLAQMPGRIFTYNPEDQMNTHSPKLNEMARAIVLTSCEETVKYPQ